jgi:hypothetical protein
MGEVPLYAKDVQGECCPMRLSFSCANLRIVPYALSRVLHAHENGLASIHRLYALSSSFLNYLTNGSKNGGSEEGSFLRLIVFCMTEI